MKHLKDAHIYLEQGDAPAALNVLEHILALAPRNTEALRLKAHILDSWGRFDDSFIILEQLSRLKLPADEEEEQTPFEQRVEEDRKDLAYSELTPEGRVYFSFSKELVFIAMYGLVGCLIFLFACPAYLNEKHGLFFIGILFIVLILVPWVSLIFMNLKRIKKVFVGMQGIKVYKGAKKLAFEWNELSNAVIEYDPNINNQYLHLIVYGKDSKAPVLNFDISEHSADVKARRHFVRLILSYMNVISYLPRKENYDLENKKSAST